MLRPFTLLCLASVLTGCGVATREAHVALLPTSEQSPDYPEELEVVEVRGSEWKEIVLQRRAKPCDRRAHYVGNDTLALLREALRASPQKGFDVDCDQDTAGLTVNGRKVDLDFVRAEVGTDAKGKGARFQGLSTKSGVLIDGLLHKTKDDRDGVVVANIRRYLPVQLGSIYFWQKEDRYEVFITSHGTASPEGIYLVAPIWSGDEFRVGIARFRVTRDE